MSISRVIIEQRLADLEIALNRQEELIKTQKEALRNLRELIALDSPANGINAPSRPLSAPPIPPVVLPVAAPPARRTSLVQSNNVGPVLLPPPLPAKRDHQLFHSAGLPEPIAPAAKKPKIEVSILLNVILCTFFSLDTFLISQSLRLLIQSDEEH